MNELITHRAVRRGNDQRRRPLSDDGEDRPGAQGAQRQRCVRVQTIVESSDAYAAGVRQYDIIVSFNGVTIEDPAHFMRMLADSPIGGTVTLGLLRSGRSAVGQSPDRADVRHAQPAALALGAHAPAWRSVSVADTAPCSGRTQPRFRRRTRAIPLSTPTLIPMRRLQASARRGRFLFSMRSGPRVRSRWLSPSEMPSARVRLPGTAAQLDGRKRFRASSRAPCAAPPHEALAFERLERADEHRRRRAFGLGHGVHQIVHAVVEIHVRDAGGAIERRVAAGRAGRGVAGGIGFADVGFDFDDHAGRGARARVVHEHVADEIPRDLEGWTRVEDARQNHDKRRFTAKSS